MVSPSISWGFQLVRYKDFILDFSLIQEVNSKGFSKIFKNLKILFRILSMGYRIKMFKLKYLMLIDGFMIKNCMNPCIP